MNFLGFTSFTAIAVLLLFTQQSSGLELSLCLGDAIANGCQRAINQNDYTTSLATFNGDSRILNAKLVLRDGFIKYNTSMSAAEKTLSNRILSARSLLPTQPQVAADAVQLALQDSMNMVFNASSSRYLLVADANGYTNGTVKQGLSRSIQMLQTVELELIDQLRSLSFLTDEMIGIGGDVGIQGIAVVLQTVRSRFAAVYLTSDASFKQAFITVSRAQGPTPALGKNLNAEIAAKDKDAVAAAIQINTAATAAVRRGVPQARVELLRKLIIRSLCDSAQVADHVRTYFTYITRLAASDAYAAQSIYLAESKVICNRIQVIIANLCLELGSAGFRASDAIRNRIRISIRALLRGNDKTVIANKLAKHSTVFGLKLTGAVRSSSLTAAAQGGRYAKIALYDTIVRAAQIAFTGM